MPQVSRRTNAEHADRAGLENTGFELRRDDSAERPCRHTPAQIVRGSRPFELTIAVFASSEARS